MFAAIGILLQLLVYSSYAINGPICNYKMFPVFTGGDKDEFVNGVEVDKITKYIFTAGKSQSGNFCPAENDHGFIYALDVNGNWMWGNFFYNVSYAVQEVTGIQMSSNGTYLMALGNANSKPIVMTLSKTDGSIKQFLTIDPIPAQTETPTYYLYSGIYLDERDSQDGQTYLYLTFSMNLAYTINIIRILNNNLGEKLKIDWHMHYNKPVGAPPAFGNQPRYLFNDNDDDKNFYIVGQYNLMGSVIKFSKGNANIKYRLSFMRGSITGLGTFGLTDITTYAQAQSGQIYGCGENQIDLVSGIFRIDQLGKVKYLTLFSISGQRIPCHGLTYDDEKATSTILISTAQNAFKSTLFQDDTVTDAMLYQFSDLGYLTKAKHITFAKSDNKISTNLRFSALQKIDNYYIWAGTAAGYTTEFNQATFANSKTNPFTMRYLDDTNITMKCIRDQDIKITSSLLSYQESSLYTQYLSSLPITADGIYKLMNKFVAIYKSPYSGGFPLQVSMLIPRPCSSNSANITQTNYFYGQKAKQYDLFKSGVIALQQKMSPEFEFVFQNGTDSKKFANLGINTPANKSIVYVQTNDDRLVGTQKMVLRGCDELNNLHEINYFINVSTNSAPEFLVDIQTVWSLSYNDNITYKLPDFQDPEDNDQGEIYINSMENQEFPKFVKYVNATKSIIFNPNSKIYSGRTYYFSVVLKEKNSDYMMNTYYLTIKMNGDVIDEGQEMDNATKIQMTIPYLNQNSEGTFMFSHPVNMKFIQNNFNKTFKVYANNTEKQREELRGLQIEWIEGSNTTFNFTARFQEPYLLGLLSKRDDLLIFECLNQSLIVINPQDEILASTVASKRIEMQFDFRDEKMQFMRSTSLALYYIMIAIIAIQFFLLLFKNVGFLPLWTLIEYMQLIAFMPIYNFKLIPYLYDLFKPFLISHLILFDNSKIYEELNNDYFNINYEYYDLPVSKLIQSLTNICILVMILVAANIVIFAMSKSLKASSYGIFLLSRLSQFRYNTYLRLFMLAYFDLTFFSLMKIIEVNNTTTMRQVALFISYAFFVISIVAPVFIVAFLLRRFSVLSETAGKARFNSLILKIDKASRWRVVNIAFFFGRRLITAMLLTLPIDSEYIFLQYIFILTTSHSYILYLVAAKPYQTPLMNGYILANETFYSALIILIFIFSDATPQIHIKVYAGVALIVSIFLLVLANLLFIAYNVWRGKQRLKDDIQKAKQDRIDEEEKERKEEEERKAKKKKEEEEFSKMPDESSNNMSQNIDVNTTSQLQNGNTTVSELILNKKKTKIEPKKIEDAIVENDISQQTNKSTPSVTQQKNNTIKPAAKKQSTYTLNKDKTSDKLQRISSADINPKNASTKTKGKFSDDKSSKSSSSSGFGKEKRFIT
ncbi:UNKNOWN [Stylonychia lemnae]|uniref:TRP C-terminal domain-containing protein n=1 Tax=Stylonychia lemnae TaxID=5949 RepID=A0A077ZRY6_STYLE|nr:UNKNOWN [Stylonychia lemnae]|eukprot:CDW72642.1 UNKNOWN [Stylonychia lemnae]